MANQDTASLGSSKIAFPPPSSMVKVFFPDAERDGALIRATLKYPAELYGKYKSDPHRFYGLILKARADVFPASRLKSGQLGPYLFGECYITLHCLGYTAKDLLGLIIKGKRLRKVKSHHYHALFDGFARAKQSEDNHKSWHDDALKIIELTAVGKEDAKAFLEPTGMQELRKGRQTRVPDVLVYDRHDMSQSFFADPKLSGRGPCLPKPKKDTVKPNQDQFWTDSAAKYDLEIVIVTLDGSC